MKKYLLFLVLASSVLLFSFTFLNTKIKATNTLEEYVGTYKMIDNPYFSQFAITLKDGALYAEADQNGANKLIKQEQPDTFKSTSQYGSIIIFKRHAETKKVIKLSLLIQDNEMVGEKQ